MTRNNTQWPRPVGSLVKGSQSDELLSFMAQDPSREYTARGIDKEFCFCTVKFTPVNRVLVRLASKGLLKRVRYGVYKITPKGLKAPRFDY